MGVGPPASASRGDFLAPRREGVAPTRGGTRVPKAALGPLAMAILALLVWSSRGGSRGAPSASTARQETRSSASVVRPSHETTRASANADVVVRDGRRCSSRSSACAEATGRTPKNQRRKTAVRPRESTDLRVERVRQIIDDSLPFCHRFRRIRRARTPPSAGETGPKTETADSSPKRASPPASGSSTCGVARLSASRAKQARSSRSVTSLASRGVSERTRQYMHAVTEASTHDARVLRASLPNTPPSTRHGGLPASLLGSGRAAGRARGSPKRPSRDASPRFFFLQRDRSFGFPLLRPPRRLPRRPWRRCSSCRCSAAHRARTSERRRLSATTSSPCSA